MVTLCVGTTASTASRVGTTALRLLRQGDFCLCVFVCVHVLVFVCVCARAQCEMLHQDGIWGRAHGWTKCPMTPRGCSSLSHGALSVLALKHATPIGKLPRLPVGDFRHPRIVLALQYSHLLHMLNLEDVHHNCSE